MSKRRIIDRRIRCQAVLDGRQCEEIATAYITLPARTYVCPTHRRTWQFGSRVLSFNREVEVLPVVVAERRRVARGKGAT